MNRGRVVVIGGGLAGITAALRCADRGFEVILLESRAQLGGATYSFDRAGLRVDTGTHVVLRCYASYARLLHRFGVLDGVAMQSRFRVPVLAPSGDSVLRRWSLPPPAHLAPALLGHRQLTGAQRLRVVRTALALRRLDPDDPGLDRISFGAWLRARGEDQRTVSVLWGLFAVAALNAEPDVSSLALAVKVFRTGMLDTTEGGDIGIPLRPLGELHTEAATRALTSAGVRTHTHSKAVALRRDGSSFRVPVHQRHDAAEVDADAVIVAVPHRSASGLLEALPSLESHRWRALSSSPIVNVHVRYDRRVTEWAMVTVLDSPVQWVFDRTAASGAQRGQYLVVSLSAAREYINMRTARLRECFLPAMAQAFPAARSARVLDFFVTREPRATFDPAPGVGEVRPRAHTGVPGLVLAGSWTATGWPDTIEGAVRSGERAAELVTCRDHDVARR